MLTHSVAGAGCRHGHGLMATRRAALPASSPLSRAASRRPQLPENRLSVAPKRRRLSGWERRAEDARNSDGGGGSSSAAGTNGIDSDKAIRMAAQRLESLLAGAGDGEMELVTSSIREMPPEVRAAGFMVASSILGTIATLFCRAIDIDPWGGLDLSLNTIEAAVIGAGLSLPVLRLAAAKWTDDDVERFPALGDIRSDLVDSLDPLTHSMTALQLGLVVLSEAVVRCIWEVNMLQGGFESLFSFLADNLGWENPQTVAVLMPLIVASLSRGASDATELMEVPEETEVVEAALANADRYYNVMNADKASASEMAAAFRAVIYVWKRQKEQAMVITFLVSAAEVAVASAAWRITGSLAAPIAVIGLSKTVDILSLRKRQQKRLGV